jgi:histidinol dehydrogenase
MAGAGDRLRLVDARRGDPLPSPASLAFEPEVLEGARAILERVRAEGDRALVELTQRYDGVDVSGRIRVSDEEIAAAEREVPEDLRRAIERMADRLRRVHERQIPRSWEEEADGVRFGEVVHPVAAVGGYVPGGRASYPSTALMTAIPARVAGVERVVVCSPPAADGSVPASVRYAAGVARVDALYRIGGAQAIAALAFGTETVTPVSKIVGPGNVWVTAAKREVAGIVGIDGLAGPTELVVVADRTANPRHLAADLVAQAEHDPLARAFLVTWEEDLAPAVLAELETELAEAPRAEVALAALEHGALVLVEGERRAAEAVDRLAPEHLQVVTEDPRAFLARVRSFGAAFLGPFTPVTLGDYGVGSNHVLPTMGTARFASGLRAADLVTVSYVLEAAREGIERVGPEVEAIAKAEGFFGHARASEIRRSG